MNLTQPQFAGTDPQVLADLDAVMRRLSSGAPVDLETRRRIRERAQAVTDELRKKYGELNVAVDLIREIRDEE